MKMVRRDALRLLGVGAGSTALSGSIVGKALAFAPTSYVDPYCYCSDILVNVDAAENLRILSTGENHTLWASSIKREVAVFRNRQAVHICYFIQRLDRNNFKSLPLSCLPLSARWSVVCKAYEQVARLKRLQRCL